MFFAFVLLITVLFACQGQDIVAMNDLIGEGGNRKKER